MPSEPKPGPEFTALRLNDYPCVVRGKYGRSAKVVAKCYSTQTRDEILTAINTLAELQKPCVWEWEGKLACYTMSCGNSIGPVGTELVTKPFKFCPYCQKPITESESDHE